MGRNPQPLIDTFLRNEIPAWSRRFSESSHPDGYSFSYTTSSIQLCAILFQRSPNHILTVELYFHRLVVIQINHAHKSIHTFFCQPADVFHPHIFIANVASIPLWIKTNLRRVAQRQSTVGLNSPSIFICCSFLWVKTELPKASYI